MNDSYLVKKASAPIQLDAPWDSPQWQSAVELHVAHSFVERNKDHIPDTRIRMLYDDEYLCGLFQVKDQYVVARAQKDQDMVCKDSCVEFFVKPVNADRYFNFEMNCGGVFLLYHITDLYAKNYDKVPQEDMDTFKRFHSLPKNIDPEIAEPVTWYLGFGIPLSFFKKYSGIDTNLSGQEWTANFTKCADRCSHPCWLSWQDLGKCAFHQPDKFGKLIFE